jgi:hypothetical protein
LKAVQEKTMHTSFENQKQQKTLGPKINRIMTKEKKKGGARIMAKQPAK